MHITRRSFYCFSLHIIITIALPGVKGYQDQSKFWMLSLLPGSSIECFGLIAHISRPVGVALSYRLPSYCINTSPSLTEWLVRA